MENEKKVWQMTLPEYQATVTPILKKFLKFVDKYPQYFKKADYYGLIYLTPEEYLEREMEKLKSQGYSNIATKEYIDERWASSYGNTTTPPDYDVPSNLLKELGDYQEQLESLFGKYMKSYQPDESKNNKRSVKRASEDDTYINDLMDGNVTPEELQKIFDSVGVRIPKRVLEMKSKVEVHKYDRTTHILKAAKDKEFAKKVKDALGESLQVLRDRYKNRMENLIQKWQDFSKSFYTFQDEYKDPLTHDMLFLVDKEKKKVPDYTEKLKKQEDEYADSFISEFVFAINEKLAKVNLDFGHPEIKVNEIRFNRGRMTGNMSMKYPEFSIFVEVEVILAGGYNIQRLHERYLIKLFKDGKLINLEKLDSLKESKFLNFDEFSSMK